MVQEERTGQDVEAGRDRLFLHVEAEKRHLGAG